MTGRVSRAVLGAADGVTSISGVVAAGAATHLGHVGLAKAAIGGALASTVSMAGAEGLSEDRTDWPAVAAMAVGTLAGAALPAVPLAFTASMFGWAAVAAVAVAVAVAVGVVRSVTQRRRFMVSLLQTVGVLSAGAAVGWAAGAA